MVMEAIYYSEEDNDINSSHEIFWISGGERGDWRLSNYRSFA